MIQEVKYIFLISAIFVTDCFTQECINGQQQNECRLGTRTPYRFIANYNDSKISYEGCKEKKIWMVFRHGTRFPGIKYIPKLNETLLKLKDIIVKNYDAGKTQLTQDIIDELRGWDFFVSEDIASYLEKEGEDEMIDLAERFQSRFPDIIPEVYDPRIFKFKYTATQRTEKSAKYFAIGLFGLRAAQNISFPEPEHEDPILRFYKRCPRWKEEINSNWSARLEVERFKETAAYTNLIYSISNRIGYNVNDDVVRLIYMMCGFETAWHEHKKSPWCKILSLEEMKILEFMEDLKLYWIDGYGYKLTYEQACPALLDMFNFFQSENTENVTAYFTHSGTILKLLGLLGVANDPYILKHDSYLLHKDNRKWKTTFIDAFASNIVFILYECEEPSILFMHQEHVITLTGCPTDRPCPLSTMKKLYPDTNSECNFEDMCSIQ